MVHDVVLTPTTTSLLTPTDFHFLRFDMTTGLARLGTIACCASIVILAGSCGEVADDTLDPATTVASAEAAHERLPDGYVTLAEFTVEVNPELGSMEFVEFRAPRTGLELDAARTVEQAEWCEVRVTSGRPRTLGLVTDPASLGFSTADCGVSGFPYDGLGVFCFDATVSNYFPESLRVLAQVTTVRPDAGYNPYVYLPGVQEAFGASAADSGPSSADDAYNELGLGVFDYGEILGGESRTVRWGFEYQPGVFQFSGRMLAVVGEACNGLDDDCDGDVDEGCGLYPDGDVCADASDCASGYCDEESGRCAVLTGCGDGFVTDDETCDAAGLNGTPGECNASCSGVTPIQLDPNTYDFPRLVGDPADVHYRVLLVMADTVGDMVEETRTENPLTTTLEVYDALTLGELMFNHEDGTARFYQEASYGQLSLSGTVVGWLDGRSVLGDNIDAQEMFNNRNLFFELATPHVDYADYDIVILHGLTETGGTQIGWRFGNSITVSQGTFWVGINYMINSAVHAEITDNRFGATILPAKPWAHELGHTLDLGHATSIWCDGAVMCDDYQVRGYGDIFNYMGAGEFATHPDVLMKLKLGWLTDEDVPFIPTGVDTDIVIYPMTDVSPPGVRGVRINLDTPRMGRDILALEWRNESGFDDIMRRLVDPSYVDRFTSVDVDDVGFLVRVTTAVDAGEATSLLDMNPDTPFSMDWGIYTLGNPGKMADAFFTVGQSFTDTVNGYTLENLGLTPDGGMELRVTWAP